MPASEPRWRGRLAGRLARGLGCRDGDGRRWQRLDRQELEHEAGATLAGPAAGGLGHVRRIAARRRAPRVGGRREQPAAGIGFGLGGDLGQVTAGIGQGGDGVERSGRIPSDVGVHECTDRGVVGEADGLADVGLGQTASA